MLEELGEMAFPGAAYLAVGMAVGTAFGEQLRPLAKQAVKTGMAVADQLQTVAAEAYERSQDLIAEARHEYEQENGRSPKTAVASEDGEQEARPRRRRTAADRS
jgi:4-diphosphocytidyl-2C-methyl-D-erythritol kinase